MGPKPMAFYKKRDIWTQTHTQRGKPCEDEGRGWSNASTNQGDSEDCWPPLEVGSGAWNASPSEPEKEPTLQ